VKRPTLYLSINTIFPFCSKKKKILFSHKLETHFKTLVALNDLEMQVEYVYIYYIIIDNI